jgi:glycosyltransferase involved in cell wall biosynthesis
MELDIIHLHSPLVPVPKTRLPIVTTLHTPMKVDARYVEMVNLFALAIKLQTPISYLIERHIIARSSIINTVAKSVAEELREYGLDPGKISVLGTGVNVNQFIPAEDTPSRRSYILNVGRLAYRKGLFDLVEAADIVCHRLPEVKFIIVGSGQIEKQLKTKVSRKGLCGRFTFTGHVNHKRLIKLYQQAALYVQPSHYEGLPVTLLEAMSCGCPVIATAVSGMLDVIRDNDNGLLVPAKSPEHMAEAIIQLMKDKALRIRLSRAAHQTILERYTWEAVTDRLLADYEKALSIDR